MFIIPALVTLGAGLVVAVWLGTDVWRGSKRISTAAQARHLMADLCLFLVGLMMVLTGIHVLAS